MKVAWTNAHRLFKKADAEKVYAELEKIEERTPQNIVDYAQSHADSELHKCFTWDDSKAANLYRLVEARALVRALVFEDEETEAPTKIRVMQRASTQYEPVKKIIRNEDEYRRLLERALAELESFRQRYKNIVELEQVIEAIDALT